MRDGPIVFAQSAARRASTSTLPVTVVCNGGQSISADWPVPRLSNATSV